MKKLIKPNASMEDYSNELIQALCEYNGCNKNCAANCGSYGGTWCTGVNSDTSQDDDILF